MSTKKKKEVFNPFARRCTYTSCTPQVVPGATQKADTTPTQHLGEFQGANLVITPALPKTEVSITIQFSCSVTLMEGDILNISLPGFKGAARQFALQAEVHPDGLDTARCFMAYWSGDAKRKGAGKGGIPPKQVLQLCCTRELEENTFVIFSVPQSLGLQSPDKLANNSPKLKIEGKVVRCAEGRQIGKQSFLASTEIRKKVAIVEELEEYDRLVNQLVSTYQLSPEHRVIAESLSVEEVEQMWEAAMLHRPYAVAMPWSIAPPRLFHDYEENGLFVKCIMANAVNLVKRKDPLAVHKEVAANWGVKLASLLVLEEMLAVQCAALYPGLSRTTLLAVYLLTMLPADVARVFATTTVPKNSIMQELEGAVRMREDMTDANAAAATASPANEAEQSHSERVLSRWAALTSYLLLAGYAVSDDYLRELSNAVGTTGAAGGGEGAVGEAEETARAAKASSGKSQRATDDGEGWQTRRATAYLQPPPRLFVGLRDVSTSELEYVQSLREGDWFMLPSFVVAREEPPLPQLKVDLNGTLPSGVFSPLATHTTNNGSKASPTGATARGELGAEDEEEEDGDEGDAGVVPDSAILFEIRSAVEGLELADLSLYPCQREWLLPFSSSYRISSVKVRGQLNGMLHVVMEMVGSLSGAITDELIPEGDQLVAAMVARRLASESEKLASVLPVMSRLLFLTVRRNERRRLHPPTLLRSEYLSRYQDVQWASEAKQTLEDGTVVWQVCAHPAEVLVEEVVKPSSWEPVPSKYALQVELLFLGRTRSKKIIDEGSVADGAGGGGAAAAATAGTTGAGTGGEGGARASVAVPAKKGAGKKNAHAPLVIDLSKFTIDYAGRGPRSLRRVVRGCVTHGAVPPDALAVTGGNNATASALTVPELEAKRDLVAAQLLSWNVKLGLVENPNKKKMTATNGGSSQKGASGTKSKGK